MKIKRIIASEIATLDSDVIKGGGTDVTKELQAALDEALTCGGVHLVMDGAALVSSLHLHSNTTIECLSLDCGFFQKPHSHIGIISNREYGMKKAVYERKLKNITLIGGTYNQDCKNQDHTFFVSEEECKRKHYYGTELWTYGLEFYGVENLTIRDLHVRNFTTFAVMIVGFKNVLIENVWFDLPDRKHANNQDGLHFGGPGQ